MILDEYLNSTIDSINSETTNDDLLRISDEMSQKICENSYYYGDRTAFSTTIYGLLQEYQNNTIDKTILLSRINEETLLFLNSVQTNTDSSYSGGGGGGGRSSKKTNTEPKGITTDVFVDRVDQAIPKYQAVEESLSNTSITATISYDKVEGEIADLKKLLTDVTKDINKLLTEIKTSLFDYLYGVTNADDGIEAISVGEDGITVDKKGTTDKVTNPTFADISNLTKVWKERSPVQKADKDFFSSIGWTVDSNGLVSKNDYEYNVETGLLHNKKTGSKVYVDYFVPKNIIGDADKLASANTITCLPGSGDSTISGNDGFGNVADYKSNSIIVLPSKKGLVDKTRSYSQRLDAVADSTIFATTFSGQKSGCRNIIGGASNGGGSAVKAAAQYDIYDAAFCINYPPLLDTSKGYPEDWLTAEEIANLKARNTTLLFIESSGDDNYDRTVRGVQELHKEGLNVSFTTNRSNPNVGDAKLLDSSFWNSFAKNYANTTGGVSHGAYSGHPSCRGLMADVINSGMFDKNSYTESA